MTAKSVLMIVAYCLVVVGLVVLVALNASALTLLSAGNAALEGEISTLNAEIASMSSELDALSDPARLSQLAQNNLKLTESGTTSVVKMSVPSLLSKTEAVYDNNWFDKFLDGLFK